MARLNDLPEILERTREELERLRRERDLLATQIAKLEQLEAALRANVDDMDEEFPLSSITDVVRNILKAATEPLSATAVRDEMLKMGFDKGPYSQFLASVHVVLKRLWKNGEAFEFTSGDTKTYWWSLKVGVGLNRYGKLALGIAEPIGPPDPTQSAPYGTGEPPKESTARPLSGVQRVIKDAQEKRRKLLGDK